MSYNIVIINNDTNKVELSKDNVMSVICVFGEYVDEAHLGVGGYYRTWNDHHRKVIMQVLASEPTLLKALQEAFDHPEKTKRAEEL